MLNKFKRYQKGLKLASFFPKRNDNLCACGCGKMLTGRQTKWATESCSDNSYLIFSIYKGNTSMIRKTLYQIDEGFCRNCGVYDENWEADHIVPVFMGGGFCDIDNFQTLCISCHKKKSKIYIESHRKAISSQAASMEDKVRLNDFGAVL